MSYVVNLNHYKSKETHWITLCVNGDNVTRSDIFGIKHIPKKKKVHRQLKHDEKYFWGRSK